MDNNVFEIHNKLNLRNIRVIFIGFIILYANVIYWHIGGFDILPDFIGYLFIIRGLTLLSKDNKEFKKSKTIAICLLVLSFFYIRWFYLSGSLFIAYFLLALDSLYYILNLILIYNIYIAMINTAYNYEITDFEEKTKKYWKCILYCTIVVIIGFLFVGYFYYSSFVYAICIVIDVVAHVTLLVLLKKSYDVLDGKEVTVICSKV